MKSSLHRLQYHNSNRNSVWSVIFYLDLSTFFLLEADWISTQWETVWRRFYPPPRWRKVTETACLAEYPDGSWRMQGWSGGNRIIWLTAQLSFVPDPVSAVPCPKSSTRWALMKSWFSSLATRPDSPTRRWWWSRWRPGPYRCTSSATRPPSTPPTSASPLRARCTVFWRTPSPSSLWFIFRWDVSDISWLETFIIVINPSPRSVCGDKSIFTGLIEFIIIHTTESLRWLFRKSLPTLSQR